MYIIDNPSLIAFICMGKSIKIQRINELRSILVQLCLAKWFDKVFSTQTNTIIRQEMKAPCVCCDYKHVIVINVI